MSSSTNHVEEQEKPVWQRVRGIVRTRTTSRHAPLILPVGRSDRRAESEGQTSGDRWWIGWTSPQGERACRMVNIFVATVGIILTAPFMVLIALAVKLTSRGPIIFTQQRVGTDTRMGIDRRRGPRSPSAADRRGGPDRRNRDGGGRIFSIYKFRTMTVQPSTRKQVWARPDDPRLTPVGGFLRKYRLDELPQFFNVLKGDMNVVGPRPEQPEIFRSLREEVYGYAYRQRVPPGITGWAQINHSYDQDLSDVKTKVGLDLEYIRRRSAVEDLKIMAKTLPVMIGKKGSV